MSIEILIVFFLIVAAVVLFASERLPADMEIITRIREILEVPLIRLGATRLNLWNRIYLIVLTYLLFYLSGKLRKWVAGQLLSRTRMEPGARHAAGCCIVILT